MARLIDADALKNNCKITGEFKNNFNCVSLATLGEVIDKQPTIDPVKHGKWVWLSDDSVMCSACGKVQNTNDNCDAGDWDFCPNCGARMDGE